jgi:hypothetical protein
MKTQQAAQAGVPWLARIAVPEPPRAPQFIPYEIPVRPGARGRFVLPADLTAAEGERLCGIIRAIAFPPA